MARLVDVAERAGVSKSTVSNVIRGTALVSEDTRRRVERAIAETGYRPNAIARSLQARSSNAIGIVVPDLTNPFFAQLAVAVERAARSAGYAVLIAHTECAPETEIAAADALIERRVDGVVIGGLSLDSALPTLLLDQSGAGGAGRVGRDRRSAARRDRPRHGRGDGGGGPASPRSRASPPRLSCPCACANMPANAGASLSKPRWRVAAWRRWNRKPRRRPWSRMTTCTRSRVRKRGRSTVQSGRAPNIIFRSARRAESHASDSSARSGVRPSW